MRFATTRRSVNTLFHFKKEKDQNEANQAERIRKYGHGLASEHRTSLMVGGGIAGFVIAGVTAVRVTPKASMLWEERKCKKHDEYLQDNEKNPALTIKDYIQVTWKYYLPPIALAGVSAGMIIFAHNVDKSRMRHSQQLMHFPNLVLRSIWRK